MQFPLLDNFTILCLSFDLMSFLIYTSCKKITSFKWSPFSASHKLPLFHYNHQCFSFYCFDVSLHVVLQLSESLRFVDINLFIGIVKLRITQVLPDLGNIVASLCHNWEKLFFSNKIYLRSWIVAHIIWTVAPSCCMVDTFKDFLECHLRSKLVETAFELMFSDLLTH